MNFKPDSVEKQKPITEQANYKGDWTLLLRERFIDPITKDKFIKTKQKEILKIENLEKEGFFDKNEGLAKEEINKILNQIKSYDETVEKVFSFTKIRHRNKSYGGLSSGWGDKGTVFTDNNLSIRAKNCIEAHEKGHGIRDYAYDPDNIKDSIDEGELFENLEGSSLGDATNEEFYKEFNYYCDHMEILEMMSHLKNYFGMKAKDIFTKEHLRYAEEHYLEDMGDYAKTHVFFLISITSKTENKFLEIINSYPV